MPPINFTDAEFGDIAVFVLATPQKRVGPSSGGIAAVLVGDPAAGEAFFNGRGRWRQLPLGDW